ncbi:MAG: hypothetical protein IH600_12665 [Bacteroidetes bacterium]|nr:hypothetical protein [Bacteroidota bacterium]
MLVKKNRIPVLQIATVGLLPSLLKVAYYRLKGYKIESDVHIGLGSVVLGSRVYLKKGAKIGFLSVIRGREIEIGRFSRIGSMCFIDTHKVQIGEDTRINENVIIGGIKFPDSSITIGDRSIVMEYSYLNPSRPIKIGDNTGIGGHCFLFTHGSWSSQLEGYPVTFAPITLGDNVWLPWRVFIMPGVEIGDGCVIGANSLVAKSLPSNSLAAGSPAKIIKEGYPEKPSTERTESMVLEMVRGFVSYLESEEFSVTYETEKDSHLPIRLTVSRNQLHRTISFLLNSISSHFSAETAVYMNRDEIHTQKAHGERMTISLSPALRFGSTDVGEEFVSFISRYGIRCRRLD